METWRRKRMAVANSRNAPTEANESTAKTTAQEAMAPNAIIEAKYGSQRCTAHDAVDPLTLAAGTGRIDRRGRGRTRGETRR